MRNNEILRVAVIGLGAAARNIHLPAYSGLTGKISVVGGCDIDAEARRIAGQKFGLKRVFDNPFEMIKATSPDIVSICTPPSQHIAQALMALENNCHVFCEKPATENLADAVKLGIAAENSNRLVVINNQFPYMNIHLAAKRMINSAEFGRLLFLQAWHTFHPTGSTEAGWRGELRRRVGFEFGIHVFELARFFFDAEPLFISAQIPPPPAGRHSDAVNLISLEFEDGRAASIILNRLSRGPERYLDMRLDGEFASIHTSIGGQIRFEAGIHTREKRPFLGFNFIKGGSAALQTGNRSKIIAGDNINPFASSTAYHFDNFIEAIKNGTTPPGTIQDNLKTLALVFAAYESAEKRCSINMSDYLKENLIY